MVIINGSGNIITTSINNYAEYQICISMMLPSTISKYDRIEFLNQQLKQIYVEHRKVNRRNHIDKYLIILSENENNATRASILIRYTNQLLDETVQKRIRLIEQILTGYEILVFKAYSGVAEDIQRHHLKNLNQNTESLSISTINGDSKLTTKNWANLL